MTQASKSLALVLILGAALVAFRPDLAEAQRRPMAVEVIEGDSMYTWLSPGAIAAVDDPVFVTADEAEDFMRPEEPVLGVVYNGVAKAYSIWHLERHEVVNDVFGEEPLAVTW